MKLFNREENMKFYGSFPAILFFTALIVSGSASAGQAPSPLTGNETRYMEIKERSLPLGSIEASATPMSAAEVQSLSGLESASGIDADAIMAGTSILDLILLVLLIYLILRILD
jgi:hypothetical protein